MTAFKYAGGGREPEKSSPSRETRHLTVAGFVFGGKIQGKMGCYLWHVKPRTFLNEDNGRVERVRESFIWACSTSAERSERDDPHCSICLDVGYYLCDFPVGEGKTCDRALCGDHRHSVAPEVDYCDAHYPEWAKFRDSHPLTEYFRNVVPFGRERETSTQA